MKKLLLLTLLFITTILCAQTSSKREFRGAWIASVANLDWPYSRSQSSDAQKADLIFMLDELKAAGINAVVFQVRPECDALYESNYEPWSYWLTGEQGKEPNPFYDPLEFAVEECHKRGIELHAWLNPYRAEKTINNYPLADNHPVKAHPDWVFTRGTLKMLDPGLPEVRQHILNVIMDIVERYDVDGIHMDDYFYPYEGMGSEDAATFAKYPRGFTDLGNWRRDNINILLKDINDNVKSVKPYVKFGMSPFGIWKNGVPPGITGMNAYSQIYCDALAWLHDGSVDYLTPQLYWRIGGSQDYVKLLKWWADSTNYYNRHFYPGQIVGTDRSFTTAEIPNQIKEDRKLPDIVQGNVIFRARLITDNALNVEDSLKNNLFKNIALAPVMNWFETIVPNAPQNLRFERVEGTSVSQLVWDAPAMAGDGDTAARYVVYRSASLTPQEADLNDASNIAEVTGLKNYIPTKLNAEKKYFFVTSLDRNTNESSISNVLEISAPGLPVLASPADDDMNQGDTVVLVWHYADNAGGYNLQVSTDPTFASALLYNVSNLTDTSYMIQGLYGQTKYYWRVGAKNAVAAGEFSPAYSFTTGFPLAPELVFPAYGTYEVPLQPELKWSKNSVATSYQIQLGTSKPLITSTIVVDTTVSDTSIVISKKLLQNKVYYWRGLASNEHGVSLWSAYSAFKTRTEIGIEDEETAPSEYALEQNYPNPFNPSTIISFKLKEAGMVSLKVYDILGKEVADLVNEYKNAGTYRVEFNSHSTEKILASGLYIYTIRTNNFLFSRKMVLVK